MKALLHILAAFAICFLGWQLYRQFSAYRNLTGQMSALAEKAAPIERENARLAENLKNLQGSDAMLRELRRAGYAAPGEKVFVIIPKK